MPFTHSGKVLNRTGSALLLLTKAHAQAALTKNPHLSLSFILGNNLLMKIEFGNRSFTDKSQPGNPEVIGKKLKYNNCVLKGSLMSKGSLRQRVRCFKGLADFCSCKVVYARKVASYHSAVWAGGRGTATSS
jgi:hypothetical protein